MNLKELKEIIDVFSSKETLEELEFERSGVRLRIRRVSNQIVPATVIPAVSMPVAAALAAPVAAVQSEPSRAVEDALYYIKSPIVGTFYRSPSPTADAFVSTGDFVEKGAVVCIIEAMKLMNEIESDISGEVVSVLVENGQPVEYGERLFAIRPR